jgi:hypothetical protein
MPFSGLPTWKDDASDHRRNKAGPVTALTVLQYVTNALFIGLAGACLLEWRRRRGAATAWLVVTFGSLAVVVMASALLEATGATEEAAGWVVKPVLAAVFLFPYLLFRFTAAMDRAARRTEVVTGLLAGVAVVWTLLLPPRLPEQGEPVPGWLRAYLAAVVVQWTVISLVVAVKLWRAGRGQPKAARQRMRGLSVAATGLSVVIVVSGLAPSSSEEPGPLAVAGQVVTLVCTLLFYLAFAPPAMLRNPWRQQEQEALREAMGDLKAANRAEDVAAVMLPRVASMVGGDGAALLDEAGTPVGAHGQIPGLEEPHAARPGLLRIPLSTGALLVWASPYAPVFGRQELELLGALGSLTELALERVRTAERDSQLAAVVAAGGDAIVSAGLDGVGQELEPGRRGHLRPFGRGGRRPAAVGRGEPRRPRGACGAAPAGGRGRERPPGDPAPPVGRRAHRRGADRCPAAQPRRRGRGRLGDRAGRQRGPAGPAVAAAARRTTDRRHPGGRAERRRQAGADQAAAYRRGAQLPYQAARRRRAARAARRGRRRTPALPLDARRLPVLSRPASGITPYALGGPSPASRRRAASSERPSRARPARISRAGRA